MDKSSGQRRMCTSSAMHALTVTDGGAVASHSPCRCYDCLLSNGSPARLSHTNRPPFGAERMYTVAPSRAAHNPCAPSHVSHALLRSLNFSLWLSAHLNFSTVPLLAKGIRHRPSLREIHTQKYACLRTSGIPTAKALIAPLFSFEMQKL